MDDDAIRTLVRRLARPHSSGGKVIERAAIHRRGNRLNGDRDMDHSSRRDTRGDNRDAPKTWPARLATREWQRSSILDTTSLSAAGERTSLSLIDSLDEQQ
jgi:hypothetical protein